MNQEAYPLQWPQGWPRTRARERAKFKTPFFAAVSFLMAELKRMGADRPVLSTNVPLRKDGLPYADYRQPADPGAAVYFVYRGRQMTFACDRWDRVTDNVHAIAKSIEAIRGLERWGASDMMERAFQGFTALPAPDGRKSREWYEVLACSPDAPITEIEGNFRFLARQRHPDNGGNADDMAELNWAIKEARKRKGAA